MSLENLPAPGAAPAPSPDAAAGSPKPAETAAPAGLNLPDPFAAVAAGSLPAVSLPPLSKGQAPDPASAFVIQNGQELLKSGLELFESSDLHTVVYNPEKIDEKQLKEADKAGKLLELAPPPAAPAPDAAVAPADAPGGLAALPPPAPPPRGRLAALPPPPSPKGIVPNPIPNQLARRVG